MRWTAPAIDAKRAKALKNIAENITVHIDTTSCWSDGPGTSTHEFPTGICDFDLAIEQLSMDPTF
jgi:hypothetical protein